MEKFKTNSKKVISLLLSLIMMISVMPYGAVVADATSTSSADNIVSIARSQKGSYGGNDNKFTRWYYGKYNPQPWCAIFVMWCANQAGEYKTAIPNNARCADMVSWFRKKGLYYSASSGYVPQKGDLVFFDSSYKDGTYNHVEIVSESGFTYSSSGAKRVKCIGGNTSDSNFNGSYYVSEKARAVNQSDFKIVGYAHPNYSSTSYSITANSASDITNTSATISAKLNTTANVQKWGYYISTKKSEVSNIDGVTDAGKTHVDTSTMDWVRVNDWSSSPQSKKNLSTSVKKILGSNLKASTTYYYKFVVKIGGKWYQSGVKSFTTSANKPGSATVSVVSGYSDIGIGDTANVKWTSASGAKTYTLTMYNKSTNKLVYTKSGISGTSYTIPSTYLKTAGTYYVKLVAVNEAGSTSCSGSPTITVHKNVTVTFYDTISEQNIETQSVVYGHDAKAPKNPSQTGYTFNGWDGTYTKVKSNVTIKTNYKANQYTVKFVDGFTNDTISSGKYTYNTKLEASDYPDAPSHTNYEFLGWSEDDYTVGAETHTIYARYQWSNSYDISTSIESVERAKSDKSETVNDGYNVTVKVTTPSISSGGTTKTIKGRVVVALKTEAGRLLIETESSAFVLYPDESSEQSKEIEVFVPYEAQDEDLAYCTEVYVVNDYDSAGIISDTVKDTAKTAAANAADGWQYSTTKPTVGEDGVVAVDSSLDYVTYDVVKKTTKDSLQSASNSANKGFTLSSSTWVKTNSGTINYVKSWPRLGNSAGKASASSSGSQFNNKESSAAVGYYLYNKYNNTPKTTGTTTSSSDVTTKIEATTTTAGYGAIYYHWCCNRNNGTLTHNTTSSKWYADTTTGNKYYTFHAFWVSANDDTKWSATKTYVSSLSKNFYVRDLTGSGAAHRDQCMDSKYWTSRLAVNQQTWTQYTQKNTYTKSETTSTGLKASSASAITLPSSSSSSSTSNGVSLTTKYTYSYTNLKTYYAYKTEAEISHEDKNEYDIDVSLGSDYAGQEVTLYVYKDSQVADYTTEYIGNATVDEDGNITQTVQTREECTTETGDFTIAVALSGETNSYVVDTIEAPKPTYTVTFYDNDYETVVYEATVEEGGTVEAPSEDEVELTIPEGQKFAGWNLSTVGVNSDLKVYPVFEDETYVVTFVDWANQQVEMQEVKYGEAITFPTVNAIDGTDITWVNQETGEEYATVTEGAYISETDDDDIAVASEDDSTEDEIGTEYVIVEDDYTVTSNTVITTNYKTQEVTATFISAESELVTDDVIETAEYADEIVVSDEDIETVETVDYETRVDAPIEIEESEDYIFYGWKNIETGEYLEDTEAVESGTYYPVYEFAESTEVPQASVTTGEYDEAQTVELTCETENAVIYYTTDGTDPADSDTAIEYTEAITISKSCTLQFCAMALGMNNSGTVSELYAINITGNTPYHIVTVYSNLPQQEGYYYQVLMKESKLFDDSEFESVTGYIYNGMFLDEEMTEEFYVDSELITETMSLYASYTPIEYTVTFVDDDATVLSTQTVEYGEAATPPDVQEKEGYVFIGWDSDDYYYVDSDATYTAKYVSEDEYATVSLTRHSVKATEGYTIQLNAKISPSDADAELLWESDNCDVATVDADGLVTMVAEGTAVITVTVESTGESDTCQLTVVSDSTRKITLTSNSILDIDSSGYLRRIPDGENTVAELKEQFVNDELHYYDADGNELSDTDRIGTGTVIKLLDGDTVLDEITAVMTGDFNKDGKVNSRDVSMLMQYTVELREADEYQMIAVDVNGDGKVNNRDSAILSQYLVGKADID